MGGMERSELGWVLQISEPLPEAPHGSSHGSKGVCGGGGRGEVAGPTRGGGRAGGRCNRMKASSSALIIRTGVVFSFLKEEN